MVPIFGPLCKLPQRDLAQSPGRKRIVECLILETTEPAWLLHICRSRPTSVLQNLKIEILCDNHYFFENITSGCFECTIHFSFVLSTISSTFVDLAYI